MKIFRQSFWKTAFGLPAVIGFVFLTLLVIPSGIAEGLSCLEMVKIVFIVYSFPFCMVLFLEFDVILFDDVLFVVGFPVQKIRGHEVNILVPYD